MPDHDDWRRCKRCDAETRFPCSSNTMASGCDNFKRAGALAEAARVACVPSHPPARQMRLSDLAQVGKLKSKLDYFEKVRSALTVSEQPRIRVGNLDVVPEIAADIRGLLEQSIEAAAQRVIGDLRDLGVAAD